MKRKPDLAWLFQWWETQRANRLRHPCYHVTEEQWSESWATITNSQETIESRQGMTSTILILISLMVNLMLLNHTWLCQTLHCCLLWIEKQTPKQDRRSPQPHCIPCKKNAKNNQLSVDWLGKWPLVEEKYKSQLARYSNNYTSHHMENHHFLPFWGSTGKSGGAWSFPLTNFFARSDFFPLSKFN